MKYKTPSYLIRWPSPRFARLGQLIGLNPPRSDTSAFRALSANSCLPSSAPSSCADTRVSADDEGSLDQCKTIAEDPRAQHAAQRHSTKNAIFNYRRKSASCARVMLLCAAAACRMFCLRAGVTDLLSPIKPSSVSVYMLRRRW